MVTRNIRYLLLSSITFPMSGMMTIVGNSTSYMIAQEKEKATRVEKNIINAIQAVGLAMQVNSFIHSPVNATVAYGIEHGVSYSYAPLKSWISWQMSGQIEKLSEKRVQLQSKIQNSFLPMRAEKSELATIEHMLSMKITGAMADITEGTKQEADAAIKSLYGERAIYRVNDQLPGTIPTVNALELLQAEKAYQDRFHVEPELDMVLTCATYPRDIVTETANEVFANMDISQYKSEELFLQDLSKRMEYLKDMRLFKFNNEINGVSPDEKVIETTKQIANSLCYTTRRFQQRMKMNTLGKIVLNICSSVSPFFFGKTLETNLYDAVYNKRPHLGYKLQVLYENDWAAFVDVATDCLLMIKHQINSNLKLGAAVIDVVGNFVDKLDSTTEKLYQMRTNEQ